MKAKRLLVVEDDELLARAVERLLIRVGYEVVVRNSCAAALAVEDPFDLGVFDLDLPDGDGLAVAEQLMARGSLKRAVFFSGSSNPDLRKRASRLGPITEKSGGISTLLALIEESLTMRRRLVAGGEHQAVNESSVPPTSGLRRQRT